MANLRNSLFIMATTPIPLNPYYSSYIVPADTPFYTSWSPDIRESTAPIKVTSNALFVVGHSHLMSLPCGFGTSILPYMVLQTKKGLFDLPAEIRLIIYRMSSLIQDRQIQPKRYPFEDSVYWKPGKLLCISKAFNEEVAPLLYGHRQFYLPDGMASMTFLEVIGSKNASYVHCLQVRTFNLTVPEVCIFEINHGDYLRFLLKMTEELCPNLQCFKVNDILLEKVVRPYQRPGEPTSLEEIKSIVEAFPQLPRVTYRKSSRQLCMAAPGAEESELVRALNPDFDENGYVIYRPSIMVPRVREYRTLDVSQEIAERDR